MAPNTNGQNELRKALASCAPGMLSAAGFSMIINLLMLAGPMYMMLVYDRALGSRSESTLIGLSVLVAGLFTIMGLLTLVRSRLLVRVGNRLGNRLEDRVFDAQLRDTLNKGGARGEDPSRDLNALREFLGGQAPATLFDAPWTPVYLVVAYILHPVLGWVALGGCIALIALGVANDLFTRRGIGEANSYQVRSNRVLSDAVRNSEVVAALKMAPGLYRRWSLLQNETQSRQSDASDIAATFTSLSRTLRIMLQSAVLGLGAYLAISGELSAGSIIAASVIVGRGLAPAEQMIGSWRQSVSTRAAYRRLVTLLEDYPPQQETITLPTPRGFLQVENLFAAPPSEKPPVLKNVSFRLRPGEVLAVIGASGSGKSTLARALVGAWSPLRGAVRLDGAKLDQWSDEQLGSVLGYLPQDVELFDGTVRENIARFASEIDDGDMLHAAKRADAHDLILRLPQGYETPVGESGNRLSGGERQRVALARALYGDPALIVLDEPNANLDGDGEIALQTAIENLRAAGKTVIIVAHRPSVVSQADKILVLNQGTVASFGPSQDILSRSDRGTIVGNRPAIKSTASQEI